MHWTCETVARYENMRFAVRGGGGSGRPGKGFLLSSPNEYQIAYLGVDGARLHNTNNAWYRIITEYTGRSLTRASDKLPAISGIARWVWAERPADDYLAGLLRHDLHLGLDWICYNGARPSSRLPSWSWAAVDGKVIFYHGLASVNVNVLSFCAESIEKQLEIVSSTTVKAGPDPFGPVLYGVLRVRGRVRLGQVKVKRGRSSMIFSLRDDAAGGSSTTIASFHPDEPDRWRDGDAVLCLQLWSLRGWCALAIEQELPPPPLPPRPGVTKSSGDSRVDASSSSVIRCRRVGVAGNARSSLSYGASTAGDGWWQGIAVQELEIV